MTKKTYQANEKTSHTNASKHSTNNENHTTYSQKKQNKNIPSKSSQVDNDEEPGFKEYAIILGIFIVIIASLYIGFEIYESQKEEEIVLNVYQRAGIEDEGFTYQARGFRGERANIEFVYDLQSLENFNFEQEFTQEWIAQNRVNLTQATPNVLEDVTYNRLLIKSSGKFAQYLRFVEGVRFNENSFKTIDNTTRCEFTSASSPLIIFNYNTTQEPSVQIHNQYPHCLEINSGESAVGFVQAVDKIMYDRLLKE
ncbi:MAG: hypothetical protein ACLFPL_00140 [Candidatus Nanoarchaeia archaeon]